MLFGSVRSRIFMGDVELPFRAMIETATSHFEGGKTRFVDINHEAWQVGSDSDTGILNLKLYSYELFLSNPQVKLIRMFQGLKFQWGESYVVQLLWPNRISVPLPVSWSGRKHRTAAQQAHSLKEITVPRRQEFDRELTIAFPQDPDVLGIDVIVETPTLYMTLPFGKRISLFPETLPLFSQVSPQSFAAQMLRQK